MTIERPDLIGQKMRLFDAHTFLPLLVERAFDITEYFKALNNGYRAILTYSTATCGEVVRVDETNTGYVASPGRFLFFYPITELAEENVIALKVLKKKAREFGIHPDLLAEIIMTHATHEE